MVYLKYANLTFSRQIYLGNNLQVDFTEFLQKAQDSHRYTNTQSQLSSAQCGKVKNLLIPKFFFVKSSIQ